MRRTLSLFIVAVLTAQTALASLAESSVWAERRAAVAPPTRLASLPAPGPRGLGLPPAPSLHASPSTTSPLAAVLAALPRARGRVRAVSRASDPRAPILIHIHDVHLHEEAQANIAAAVEALARARAVDVVALEGAFGPLRLEPFRRFPDREATAMVARYLARENRISPVVQTGLTAPEAMPSFIGVDDEPLYEANVAAYRRAFQRLDAVRAEVDRRRRDLNAEKARVFGPDLRALDRAVEAYHRDESGLGAYARTLDRMRRAAGAPAVGDALARFIEALRRERALNFDAVERERASLFNRLLARLSTEATADLMAAVGRFRAGELDHVEFYGALRNRSRERGLRWSDFPALSDYLAYLAAAGSIDADRLFASLRTVEEDLFRRLSRSPAENRLIAASRRLALVSKLTSFSLTRPEWDEYKQENPKSGIRNPKSVAARSKPVSSPFSQDIAGLAPFEDFYRRADARDRAMGANLLRAVANRNARAAVLVAGGFHADGIRAIAEKKGFTVVSFVPGISKIKTGSGADYLSAFARAKTPLDRLFEGKEIFLSPRVGVPVRLRLGLLKATVNHRRSGRSPASAESGDYRFVGTYADGELTDVSIAPSDARDGSAARWASEWLRGIPVVGPILAGAVLEARRLYVRWRHAAASKRAALLQRRFRQAMHDLLTPLNVTSLYAQVLHAQKPRPSLDEARLVVEDAQARFKAAPGKDTFWPAIEAVERYVGELSAVDDWAPVESLFPGRDVAAVVRRNVARIRLVAAMIRVPESTDVINLAGTVRWVANRLDIPHTAPIRPLYVRASRVGMARLLVNLYDNALAQAGPKPLVMTLRLARVGDRAVLTVEDNAGGVRPENAALLAETKGVQRLFIRGETTKGGGHGTGLADVRADVRRWGGAIRAANIRAPGNEIEPGLPAHGLRIVVEWPVAPEQNDAFTDLVRAPLLQGLPLVHFFPLFPWTHERTSWHQFWIGMPLIYLGAGLLAAVVVPGAWMDPSLIVDALLIWNVPTWIAVDIGGIVGHVAYNALARRYGWAPLSLSDHVARPTDASAGGARIRDRIARHFDVLFQRGPHAGAAGPSLAQSHRRVNWLLGLSLFFTAADWAEAALLLSKSRVLSDGDVDYLAASLYVHRERIATLKALEALVAALGTEALPVASRYRIAMALRDAVGNAEPAARREALVAAVRRLAAGGLNPRVRRFLVKLLVAHRTELLPANGVDPLVADWVTLAERFAAGPSAGEERRDLARILLPILVTHRFHVSPAFVARFHDGVASADFAGGDLLSRQAVMSAALLHANPAPQILERLAGHFERRGQRMRTREAILTLLHAHIGAMDGDIAQDILTSYIGMSGAETIGDSARREKDADDSSIVRLLFRRVVPMSNEGQRRIADFLKVVMVDDPEEAFFLGVDFLMARLTSDEAARARAGFIVFESAQLLAVEPPPDLANRLEFLILARMGGAFGDREDSARLFDTAMDWLLPVVNREDLRRIVTEYRDLNPALADRYLERLDDGSSDAPPSVPPGARPKSVRVDADGYVMDVRDLFDRAPRSESTELARLNARFGLVAGGAAIVAAPALGWTAAWALPIAVAAVDVVTWVHFLLGHRHGVFLPAVDGLGRSRYRRTPPTARDWRYLARGTFWFAFVPNLSFTAVAIAVGLWFTPTVGGYVVSYLMWSIARQIAKRAGHDRHWQWNELNKYYPFIPPGALPGRPREAARAALARSVDRAILGPVRGLTIGERFVDSSDAPRTVDPAAAKRAFALRRWVRRGIPFAEAFRHVYRVPLRDADATFHDAGIVFIDEALAANGADALHDLDRMAGADGTVFIVAPSASAHRALSATIPANGSVVLINGGTAEAPILSGGRIHDGTAVNLDAYLRANHRSRYDRMAGVNVVVPRAWGTAAWANAVSRLTRKGSPLRTARRALMLEDLLAVLAQLPRPSIGSRLWRAAFRAIASAA